MEKLKRTLLIFYIFITLCRTQTTRYSKYINPTQYTSPLITTDESDRIFEWINWANNVPRFTLELNAMPDHSFHPESWDYIESIALLSIYYIIYMFIFLFFFIFITCFRIMKKRFGANFDHIRIKKWTTRIPMISMLIGSLLIILTFIIIMYGNIVCFVGVVQAINSWKYESQKLIENIEYVNENIDAINKIYANLINKEPLSSMIQNFDKIRVRTQWFANESLKAEIARFVWIWLEFIVIISLLVLSVISFYSKKRKKIIITTIIILIILFLISLILMGLNSSEFVLIIDICKDYYTLLDRKSNIASGTGIKYFLDDISYSDLGTCISQQYSISVAYDTQFELFKTTSGRSTITTMDDLNKAMEDSALSSNQVLFQLQSNIQKMYNMVISLYDIRYQRHIMKVVQETESNLCVSVINGYLYYYFGIIGLLIWMIIVIFSLLRLYMIKQKREQLNEQSKTEEDMDFSDEIDLEKYE